MSNRNYCIGLLPVDDVGGPGHKIECRKLVEASYEDSSVQAITNFHLFTSKNFHTDTKTKDLINGNFQEVQNEYGNFKWNINSIDYGEWGDENNIDKDHCVIGLRKHLEKLDLSKKINGDTIKIYYRDNKYREAIEAAIKDFVPVDKIEFYGFDKTNRKVINTKSDYNEIEEIKKDYVHNSDDIKGILDRIVETAKQVNPKPILLFGPPGVGKSYLAIIYCKVREVFGKSIEEVRPWDKIMIAGGKNDIFDVEMFGSMPGAYTDAPNTYTAGLIENHENGTILIDEFGKLSSENMDKCISILEPTDKKYKPVGQGAPTKETKTHFILTMNEDIDELKPEIKRRVEPIYIKPLNDRIEDIEPLINYYNKFWSDIKEARQMTFSRSFYSYMKGESWPYNADSIRDFISYLYEPDIKQEIIRDYDYDNIVVGTIINEQIQKAKKQYSQDSDDGYSFPPLDGNSFRELCENSVFEKFYIQKAIIDLKAENPGESISVRKVCMKLNMEVNIDKKKHKNESWLERRIQKYNIKLD